MKESRKSGKIIIHAVLILGAVIMLIPFAWMILTAFKSPTEATQIDPFIIFPKTWLTDSFASVAGKMNFLKLYLNTLLMILGRVLCAVVTASLAGYALGRLEFKGKKLCFALVMFQMMVPVQIFIIPQYLMISKMGMMNTTFSLIFPGLVTAFGTFLLRQSYGAAKGSGRSGKAGWMQYSADIFVCDVTVDKIRYGCPGNFYRIICI